MIRAAIAVLALLIIVGGVVGGVYYWNKLKEPEVAPITEGGPELALGDATLEVTEAEEPLDVEPIVSDDEAGQEVVVPIGEEVPIDLSEDALPVPDSGRAISEQPVASETPSAPQPEITQPAEAPAEGTSGVTGLQPIEITPTPVPPAPTPVPISTPIPTTPVVSPTPVPVATPAPAIPAGNYSVYTFSPVSESTLSTVRKAMKPLGVNLKEEKVGQQNIQAYRVAIGYFTTKQQAESWARTNFKPRSVQYYVFPAQGMYSIQVGVFSQRQNVDRKIRDLYQKFPGWRLPIRTEMTTIGRATYHLSIRRIPESLARKVQNELVRVGVQAELAGI